MIFRNVGLHDRLFRVSLGASMLCLGWLGSPDGLTMPMRIFALYPLITGVLAWCPIYAMLHFDSRQR